MTANWQVRLTLQAEQDFVQVIEWTQTQFGPDQAIKYSELITNALAALYEGPEVLGSKHRPDILPNIYTLHIARYGQKGRHFVVFKPNSDSTIDVLRILHDSMDLVRHLSAANDDWS